MLRTASRSVAEAVDAFMSTRARTLELVDGLAQEDFDRRADPRRWSIGEVLDHLLRVERFIQRDLEWLLERAGAGRPGHIRHSFRDLDIGLPLVPRSVMPLLDWPLSVATALIPSSVFDYLTRTRLFTLRHPAVAEPARGRAAADLRRELHESAGRTAGLMGRFSPEAAAEMTVSHPMLGNRSVANLIRFASQHEIRHQGQVADLIAGRTARGRGGRLAERTAGQSVGSEG